MRFITLNQVPAQRFYTVLDDQNVILTLRQKAKRLYLDMDVSVDGQTIAICRGAICVENADLIQSPRPHFSGTLHFYDTRGRTAPHWADLESRYILAYFSPDEELPDILKF